MSLLDKKLFLADLEEKLADAVPTNEARRILLLASEALERYEIRMRPEDAPKDDSDDLLRLFLDAKGVEGRSEKTVTRYRYILTRLRMATGIPLSRITIHHLRGYFMREMERGVSLSTLEGYRYVFTSFYGWCRKEELLPKDPTVNLAPIRTPKVIRKPFSTVEVDRLKLACKTVRDRALVYFLLSTGCRVSEVCGLDVVDIRPNDRAVTVIGKGNKQREVYLDDAALRHVDAYLTERDDDSPALFLGKGSDRLTPNGVRALLKRLERVSGVENVHPHRFRRTLATSLIDHGMAIQEVAAILGHDKVDTTMTYVYVDQKKVESAYRRYA